MKIGVSKKLKLIITNLRQLGIEVVEIDEGESLHDINEEMEALILDGYLPHERLSALLVEAREHNLMTCIDHINFQDIKNKRELLKTTDIFCPNKEEMMVLCEKQGETLDEIHRGVKKLLEEGIKFIAVTMGNDGVFMATRKVRKLIPAHIVPVADEDGAGDAFVAGVFYGLHKNYDVEKAIECGIAAGSITVASYGDYSFDLKPDAIEEIIKDRVKR